MFRQHFGIEREPASLLIDTNILLLAIVGGSDTSLITRFKRVSNRYAVVDFELLLNLMGRYSKLVTTPHVLAEVSSFLGQLPSQELVEKTRAFLFSFVQQIDERHVPAGMISMDNPIAIRLGLTDAVVVQLAGEDIGILTDDAVLYTEILRAGGLVMNFTHLRDLDS